MDHHSFEQSSLCFHYTHGRKVNKNHTGDEILPPINASVETHIFIVSLAQMYVDVLRKAKIYTSAFK